MSDLPSDALGYQTVVTEYFLGLRGSGLLLSPLDIDLVADWERRGLPVAVVCRGLRSGLERLLEERAPGGATLPRSLRAYRFAVEDEWRAYKSGRVGESPPPPGEAGVAQARLAAALAWLEGSGRTVAGPLRSLYGEVRHRLAAQAPATLSDLEAALTEVDDQLLMGWLRGLGRAERSAIGPRCRLLAGARLPGTRPTAHRRAIRAHLWDVAQAAGLIRIRGSV